MLAASSSSWDNTRYHFPCGYHAGCLFLFMGQYQVPLPLWISCWMTLPLQGAIPGSTFSVDIMMAASSSSWGNTRYHFPCGYIAGCLFLFMGQYQVALPLWISCWLPLPLHGAIPGSTFSVDIMMAASSSSWGNTRFHFPCGYHAGCLFLFMGQYQVALHLWISCRLPLPLHGAIPGTTSTVDIKLAASSSSLGNNRYQFHPWQYLSR
jgi:hypothetical protein